MPYLTPRCFSMVRILMERGRPVTIEELARALHVSARTIRYDLDTLADWLAEKEVGLIRKSRVGIYLDQESAGYSALGALFLNAGDQQRIYSGAERQRIVKQALLSGARCDLGELAERTNVSKSTVFRDLEEVEQWLSHRRIRAFKGGGITASGSELDLRKALADLVYEEHGIQALIKWAQTGAERRGAEPLKPWHELSRPALAPVLAAAVRHIQQELDISYTDESVAELFVHLGILLARVASDHPVTLPEQNMERLRETEEFGVTEQVLAGLGRRLEIALPPEELCYFTMHVLGAGVSHLYRTEESGGKGEVYFKTAVVDFIAEVSHTLGINLSSDNELLVDLMLELRPWVSRAQFQVGIERRGNLEVRNAYRESFQAVWSAVPLLELQFNVKFDEALAEELTTHVAAAQERMSQGDSNKYVTAIVLCGAGLGTAKLLSSRISREFGQIKVLRELSLAEFQDFDASSVDIVFSAIPLEGEPLPNVIEVAPLLDLESKAKIYQYLGDNFAKAENKDRYLQKILMIIENNCVIENRKKLYGELEQFLYTQKVHSLMGSARSLSLGTLVTKRRIAFQAQAADYREAITIGGELLLRDRVIHREYIGAMIEHTANFVSNVVVAPAVALAHAAPNGRVSEVCMSMVLLREPVVFDHPRNDPVKLVVCLGTVDNHSHEKAIYDFLKILENKYLLNNILNAKSVKEILLTINGIC